MAIVTIDARGTAEIANIVRRDLERRARNVAGRAKQLCPVDTGRLRSSIGHDTVEQRGTSFHIRIGTNVRYARFVHRGTGIYGPRGRPIRPVRARVLRFTSHGRVVFARQTRGSRGRPFLADALVAARS